MESLFTFWTVNSVIALIVWLIYRAVHKKKGAFTKTVAQKSIRTDGVNFEKEPITKSTVKCYSVDKQQCVDINVDNMHVYHGGKIIGVYNTDSAGKITVNTANAEIVAKCDDFVQFINCSPIHAQSQEPTASIGSVLGPTVEVNDSFIATMDDVVLASHNGQKVHALAAFICAHANFFAGVYHDFFTA